MTKNQTIKVVSLLDCFGVELSPLSQMLRQAIKFVLLSTMLLVALTTQAQLAVTVLPPQVTAQKAVVKLVMHNEFSAKIESARAVCFLLDNQGKMVSQTSKWIIGGNREASGLPAGGTNTFNFVMTIAEQNPTNLTAKITFTRLILDGGKSANPNKDIKIDGEQKTMP